MENEAQQPAPGGEKIIRILAFTLVISVMSATMFNIVLPEIAKEFQLTMTQVSWVSSAYLLIYAIGTVLYGKLADRYPLKHLLTFGLLLFAAGSMVGLAAHTYWTVLLGRVIQAVGAAVIPATAGIIPVRYFPEEIRGRALGISMTGLAVGSALGPIVAASLAGAVHWRWLFCMPLLMLLTLPYYRKYLKEEPGKAGRIDWVGGGLLAGAVAMLLLAITIQSWMIAALCLIFFVGFAVRIRSVAEPFIQLDLLKNKGYSLGILITFFVSGIGYSIPFLMPQLFSHVNHLDPGFIGLAMAPAAVVSALLGRRGGKLADTQGNAVLFYLASVLLLTCFILLSSFAGTSPALISLFLILGQVGQTFIFIAMSNSISRTLSQEQVGIGMGLLSMLNFIAGAVSATVYSRVADQVASIHWNPVNGYPEAFAYSNLFMVLTLLHLCILLIYFFQFGRFLRKSTFRLNVPKGGKSHESGSV